MLFRSVVLAVTLAAVSGCAPAADANGPDLNVDNGTDLLLTVIVNEQAMGHVAAHAGQTSLTTDVLPTLPWSVELRSPSRRLILDLEVEQGVVTATAAPDGHTSLRGAAARVDLSCGRLDAWAGPPLAGPPPGPGAPGDCKL